MQSACLSEIFCFTGVSGSQKPSLMPTLNQHKVGQPQRHRYQTELVSGVIWSHVASAFGQGATLHQYFTHLCLVRSVGGSGSLDLTWERAGAALPAHEALILHRKECLAKALLIENCLESSDVSQAHQSLHLEQCLLSQPPVLTPALRSGSTVLMSSLPLAWGGGDWRRHIWPACP